MKTSTLPTLTVLFADDDSDEFYLFNEALEQSYLNVNVINVQDGRKLISSLQNGSLPDIIFMDVNMPHKDGIETLVEIRESEQFGKIPVIIFSTSKNVKQVDSCYQKGANYYIVKPESFDDITKAVKKIFSLDWKTNSAQPPRDEFVLEY